MALRSDGNNKLEHDDEEEDVVIYGDQSASQVAEGPAISLPSQFSQTAPRVVEPPAGIIPRHERRKRRQEWRDRFISERQRRDASPSSSDDGSNSSLRFQSGGDAFAALQELLDSAPPSQSQECEQQEHKDETIASERGLQELADNRVRTEEEPSPSSYSKPPNDGPSQDTDLRVEPSPPDFPIANNDASDEDNDKKRRRSLRKQKQERIHAKAKRTKHVTLQPSDFETPQSPVRSVSQSRGPPPPRNHNRLFSTRSIGTKMTKDANTIVGIRPTHWNRPLRATQSQRDQRISRNISRAAALKAATRQPLGQSSQLNLKRNQLAPQPAKRKHRLSGDRESTATRGDIDNENDAIISRDADSRRMDPRKVDFRPSFAPKMQVTDPVCTPPGNSNGQEFAEDVPGVTAPTLLPLLPSPTKVRRNRNSPKRPGPWIKRLTAIRNARSNDVMKLQHPGINRQGLFTLNDPRNRVTSYVDVTILGETSDIPCAWNNGSVGDAASMTVLGHIHRFVSHVTKDSEGNNSPNFADTLAWVSFTLSTARSISLQKNVQLRIYNSVILPIDRGDQIPMPNGTHKSCKFVLICTQLCELYPNHLEPLPNVVQLVAPKD